MTVYTFDANGLAILLLDIVELYKTTESIRDGSKTYRFLSISNRTRYILAWLNILFTPILIMIYAAVSLPVCFSLPACKSSTESVSCSVRLGCAIAGFICLIAGSTMLIILSVYILKQNCGNSYAYTDLDFVGNVAKIITIYDACCYGMVILFILTFLGMVIGGAVGNINLLIALGMALLIPMAFIFLYVVCRTLRRALLLEKE